MSIPYSVLLFVFLLRSIFGRRTVAYYQAPAKAASENTPGAPENHEPRKNSTLAGVPLWLLESERSNPGALLRDTLLNRPSARDD